MFHSLSATELFIILAIVLVLFGSRLPQVGKSIGEGIANFKKGLKSTPLEEKDTQKENFSTPPPQTVTQVLPHTPEQVSSKSSQIIDVAQEQTHQKTS